MSWHQRDLRLPLLPRGFRLVTRDVAEALAGFPPVRVGLLHVFLCHTSASLSINENADPDVPLDLATALRRADRGHVVDRPDRRAEFPHLAKQGRIRFVESPLKKPAVAVVEFAGQVVGESFAEVVGNHGGHSIAIPVSRA